MWGKRKRGASKPWKSGNVGELRLSYTPCALSGPLSFSLQNLPQSPRETQEPHRTKPQSWGIPSREAVWLVSPFSREDPLSEERGNTEHLDPQFLCPHARVPARAHTHTPIQRLCSGPVQRGKEPSGAQLQGTVPGRVLAAQAPQPCLAASAHTRSGPSLASGRPFSNDLR